MDMNEGQPTSEVPSVPLAAQLYLPVLSAALTAMVWWRLPGTVLLAGWTWIGPLSAVAATVGALLPTPREPGCSQLLLRVRNGLGLVFIVNVLASAVFVALAVRALSENGR